MLDQAKDGTKHPDKRYKNQHCPECGFECSILVEEGEGGIGCDTDITSITWDIKDPFNV